MVLGTELENGGCRVFVAAQHHAMTPDDDIFFVEAIKTPLALFQGGKGEFKKNTMGTDLMKIHFFLEFKFELPRPTIFAFSRNSIFGFLGTRISFVVLVIIVVFIVYFLLILILLSTNVEGGFMVSHGFNKFAS
jgi:hypothetical protein